MHNFGTFDGLREANKVISTHYLRVPEREEETRAIAVEGVLLYSVRSAEQEDP